MNIITKQKQNYGYKEHTGDCQRGGSCGGWGGGEKYMREVKRYKIPACF